VAAASVDAAAVGLLHVGFARPDTADVRALLKTLTGGLYVTESSRHAVPRECVVSPEAAGRCEGRAVASQAVYRSIGTWLGADMGGETEASAGSEAPYHRGDSPPPSLSKSDGTPAWWLERLDDDCPEAAELLRQGGVRTEEDYQHVRERLPASARLCADRVRFVALTESLPLVDPFTIAPFLPDWAYSAPLRDLGLSKRPMNVFTIAGLTTVADALALGPIGLMELRNFGRTSLQDFVERLHHFVAVPSPFLTFSDETNGNVATSTSSHVPPPEPPTLRAALEVGLDSIAERDAEVIRLWLGLHEPPKVLEEIGSILGVTRERARQIRNRGWEHLRDRGRWSGEVVHRIEGLLSGRSEPLYLDLIAADDVWFDGFQDCLTALCRIIEELAGRTLHVWSLNGRLIVTRCAADRWPEMIEAARVAVEREIPAGVTRSDAHLLIGAIAVAEGTPELAEPLWDRLAPELHYAATPDGEERLASVGRGLRHPLAAVLNESDRPLHISEIIERLSERGYLDHDTFGTRNMVRNAVREAGGVLYGRSVYGLEKHLPVSADMVEEALVELESIVAEGSPGRQWHCSELADELTTSRPDLAEDLDQFTINTILKRSNQVTYLGRLVWVGTHSADGPQDRLDIAALCEAALLDAGRPLSKRELRDAIQQVRGLNRHFLPQASERVVRLAHGMWGLADRDVGVSAVAQRAALDALHVVLGQRQKGLHVSELFTAFENIAFRPDPGLDEWELLGIAQSDVRFRVGRGQIVGLADWDDVRRRSIGQAFAELLARWQDPMTSNDLHAAICALTEREVARIYLASHAARGGLAYDTTRGVWDLADAADEADRDGEDDL
jgi:hypothetical protein